MRTNPFYDLYLADSMPGSDYVRLFSPILIDHVQPIFRPGNVVITGMQGAGKSMLLTLLRLETRLIYHKERVDFPIDKASRKFISCSVNLAHSGATDFGYRSWVEAEPIEVELLFGDFVNSLLFLNLLLNLRSYASDIAVKICQEVGFRANLGALDDVAKASAREEIWHGWYRGVETFGDLLDLAKKRVSSYRDYLHRRRPALDFGLAATKTPFGDPLSAFVKLIKDKGICDADSQFFIDIDQYEELGNIRCPTFRNSDVTVDYRSVINRGLSKRDPLVSYRIGTRPHSWRNHSNKIIGSIGRLEEERDYKYVDLDVMLKRDESRRTYIFPDFAQDVFQRRLAVAGIPSPQINAMDYFYGKELTAVEKATHYNPNRRAKGLKIDRENWSPEVQDRIEDLGKKNILTARLGEAWLRQKGEWEDVSLRNGELPWMRKDAEWWRKERLNAALLQLASSNQQRPLYSGTQEIIDLSSGNILTFVSINQHIWDQFIRYQGQGGVIRGVSPEIGIDLQSIGIINASQHWLNKIGEETGSSAERSRFIQEVARVLRQDFMADRSLTYPGAGNGFSLKVEELEQFPEIKGFLAELSDYGNLLMLPHTTKDSRGDRRIKWYISSIICPILRIPYRRVKEPRYSSIKEVYSWIESININLTRQTGRRRASQLDKPIQMSLL